MTDLQNGLPVIRGDAPDLISGLMRFFFAAVGRGLDVMVACTSAEPGWLWSVHRGEGR